MPVGLTAGVAALAALALPGGAVAATATPPRPQPARPPVATLGTLTQLPDASGCLVDRSKPRRGCTPVRALQGPGPFLGSDAIAVSPDGRNVYVASSDSDAVAIFKRNARTGALRQASGTAGCIAARGAGGCATAIGLDGPNSLAVSADGANVYATALDSDAVVTLRRDATTGALRQEGDGSGCIAGQEAIPGCAAGRAIKGPDVVTVSADGKNVYVGSFVGNTVTSFARNGSTGALTQLADTAGCLVDTAVSGCATGIALKAPEGMAISGDGATVYVATAVSNALLVLARNPSTGALTQATDGSGCIADAALTGCSVGVQLAGANAVAVSPGGDDVYVTSLMSNSVTSFARNATSGQLTQLTGTSACAIHVLAVGCSLARSLRAPEGLAVSPDGASVYAAAFSSGALDVFDRDTSSGAIAQKSRLPGCLASARPAPDCTPARGLLGASSVAVSPDGKNVYVTGNKSDAVAAFGRITKSLARRGRS